MSVVSIATLKAKYETGDFPTEQDFIDLIDTLATLPSASNLDLTWTDYSSTSTIVGFVATPTKDIQYCVLGKLLMVRYYIQGTSDTTTVSFTLPYTAAATQVFTITSIKDNTVASLTPGYGSIVSGASTCNCYTNAAGGAWTAAGQKQIFGTMFIQIN